jgi:hypothetical protein
MVIINLEGWVDTHPVFSEMGPLVSDRDVLIWTDTGILTVLPS